MSVCGRDDIGEEGCASVGGGGVGDGVDEVASEGVGSVKRLACRKTREFAGTLIVS